jgi:hypothetical protein
MRALALATAGLTLAVAAASAQIANTGVGTPNSGGSPLDQSWNFSCSVQVLGMAACNTSGKAFIPLDIPSPPWQPDNGSVGPNWISAWTDASSTSGTGNNAKNYDYTFSTSVGSAGLYSLTLGWDNQLVGVFQDGNLLYGPSQASAFCRDGDGVFPTSDYPACVVHTTLNLASANDLTIEVTGDGTTDGIYVGFDNAGNPTAGVTPEPGTMGLLATGLVGLMGASRRRRKL